MLLEARSEKTSQEAFFCPLNESFEETFQSAAAKNDTERNHHTLLRFKKHKVSNMDVNINRFMQQTWE